MKRWGVGIGFAASSWMASGCPAVDVSVGAVGRDAAPSSARVDAAAPAGDAQAPSPQDATADVGSDGSELFNVAPVYLEAELGALSGGFWVVESSDASGRQALAPPEGTSADGAPGEARARYVFTAPTTGAYVIWGRIRSPDASHNRFWFAVDDDPFRKWRISVGDIWFWDDLHEDFDYGNAMRFQLTAGEHVLALAPAVDGVELDALYITQGGDVPPGNDTPCSPPHSIEVGGACLPSCGAQQGRACGAVTCEGRVIVEAYDCDVCCLEG